MEELIRDLALSIMMAWLLGVGAHFLRQPLLLAYLAGGFILGPSGLKWVQSQESIATISELGLLFMLFMIGLEIDLKKIVSAGKVIAVTSGAQILGCCVCGVLLFMAIGLPMGAANRWDALYLGVAVALSSTVIIVKVLYDKRELDTLPGRVTLGVLVSTALVALGYHALDVVAGIVVAGFIGFTAFSILKENLNYLADRALVHADQVLAIAQAVPGVLSASDVRTRGAPGAIFVDLHIQVPGETTVAVAHDVSHLVADHIRSEIAGIADVHVHIEPA